MTLKDILAATESESLERQQKHPLKVIQRKIEKMGPTRGFARALKREGFSIIAEIKRKSPSMGPIAHTAIDHACQVYHDHRLVSAISVLTQNSHFGGSTDDLEKVRQLTQSRPKPILRKDFIFSDYEVFFSRWIGADAILLMANVVEDPSEFRRLHHLARSIGLDVLCEVHDESELDLIPDSAEICGINSRRFKGTTQRKNWLRKLKEDILIMSEPGPDTRTDLDTFDLFEKPSQRVSPTCLKIAESGISAENLGQVLKKHPFDAALIGTSLLKSGNSEAIRKTLDYMQQVVETSATLQRADVSYAGS